MAIKHTNQLLAVKWKFIIIVENVIECYRFTEIGPIGES